MECRFAQEEVEQGSVVGLYDEKEDFLYRNLEKSGTEDCVRRI